MRYFPVIFILLSIIGCGAKKEAVGNKPLYEILTQQSDGGANIRFYEILTEQKEIGMLLNDEFLKDKIEDDDIRSANFLILNMGEKSSGGHSITIDSVEETPDKIIVRVKEKEPAPGEMATMAITYPYTIVKINSKKNIVIE